MKRRPKLRNAAAWSLAILTTAAISFTGCSSSSGGDSGAGTNDAGDTTKNDGSVGGGDGSTSGGGCPSDQTKCGSDCVSIDRDTQNCGSCGHACADGEVCSSGSCGITCGSGLTMCSNVVALFDAGPAPDAGDSGATITGDAGIRAPYCATLASDNQNCGTCGNVCPGVLACREGSCTRYSGVTGAWQVVASTASNLVGGYSDFSPPGTGSFFATDETNTGGMFRYDPSPVNAFTPLTASPEAFTGDGYYSGPAWIGGALYAFAPDKVMQYDIAADTWSAPLTATIDVVGEGQHTHDDSGHVYAVANDGNVIQYDVTAKTIKTITLSAALTGISEPRLAWDSATHLLFAAPSYDGTELDSIDAATGMTKLLTPVPDTQISDVFCADRNGHLYASGTENQATLYRYDIATDTWTLLSNSPPPFTNGNEGSCTVTSDGWLYYTDGHSHVARLQLF